MTNTQKQYLRWLGYGDTKEDGAILECKKIYGDGRYVWKTSTFKEVLESFQDNYKRGYLKNVAKRIIDHV